MRLARVLLVTSVFLATACNDEEDKVSQNGADETPGASASAVARTAFVSDRDGNQDIYVVNSDGSGLTNLTKNSADDGDIFPEAHDEYGFLWSPDGTRIAFETSRETEIRFYLMNADGSNQTALVNRTDVGLASESVPTWSPDGRRIAFNSLDRETCLVNADGLAFTCLANDTGYGEALTWSPDGNWLAYIDGDTDNPRVRGLMIIGPDGSNLTSLANNASSDSILAWSPDGKRIAFNSYWGVNADIYVADIGVPGAVQLTEDLGLDLHPSWSPDGSRIAFSSSRAGSPDIYLMDADGPNQTRLTDSDASEILPAWSPDGRQIAFVSADEGEDRGNTYQYDIHVISATGSNLTLVADGIAGVARPQWQPAQ